MKAIVRAVPRISRLPVHRCGEVKVPRRLWADLDDEERAYWGGIVHYIARKELGIIGKRASRGKSARQWLKAVHGMSCPPKDNGTGLAFDIMFQCES